MPRRHERTDAAWATLAPLLPRDPKRGERWRDHRTVIDGMRWKLTTGVPWRDVPARYGPWSTLHARRRRWERDGTWARLLRHVQQHADAAGGVDWEVRVASTIVRARQHAAGARNKGGHRPPRRSAAAAAG